jgi:hypothetical protein
MHQKQIKVQLLRISAAMFKDNCIIQAETIDFRISQPAAKEVLFESQQEAVLKIPLLLHYSARLRGNCCALLARAIAFFQR